MCCGKALQNNEEQPRHECLWQHLQQQNVNLSTSRWFKTMPGRKPSGWSNAGNESVELAAASSSSESPSCGFLGTISRISPSWLCSDASLLYWTLNLSMKQVMSKTMKHNKKKCILIPSELFDSDYMIFLWFDILCIVLSTGDTATLHYQYLFIVIIML